MQVVKQFATTISFLSKTVISEELLQQLPQGYVMYSTRIKMRIRASLTTNALG